MTNIYGDSSRGKGDVGEDIAADYIENLGYKIIKRNYRMRTGEIDIIAKDGSYIVFIEVKYRKNAACGNPLESITLKKQSRIKKTALNYIRCIGTDTLPMRFDVIGILGNKITHIKNAF